MVANQTFDGTRPNAQEIVLDEGNPITDSNVTTSRTTAEFKTGRQFRFGIRATF